MGTMPPPRQRIYLECSRTSRSSLNTGIERVVRNIVECSEDIGVEFGVECIPVVYHPQRGFVAVSRSEVIEARRSRNSRVTPFLMSTLERMGLMDFARRLKAGVSRGSRRWKSSFSRTRGLEITVKPNDVLLLLDSSWQESYWENVQCFQQKGGHLAVTIYDLLPLEDPASFTRQQVESFKAWWDPAYQHANFFAAISKSVYQSILQYDAEVSSRQRPIAGGAFRLGMDFQSTNDSRPVREALCRAFSHPSGRPNRPSLLAVGTLSPRKNQEFVLDACESLWKDGADFSLVLVGNRGWHSRDVIHRLQRHPEWNQRLFWWHDLSDVELDYCYKQARALITASRGEGFNLPIVEALHRGCEVFASDIPVHREVAGPSAVFFSIDDKLELEDLLRRRLCEKSGRGLAPPNEASWPSWRESCRELLTLIRQFTVSDEMRRSA